MQVVLAPVVLGAVLNQKAPRLVRVTAPFAPLVAVSMVRHCLCWAADSSCCLTLLLPACHLHIASTRCAECTTGHPSSIPRRSHVDTALYQQHGAPITAEDVRSPKWKRVVRAAGPSLT